MDVVITRCAGLDVHQATVVATVRVGGGPLGVATDPQAKAIYVANNFDNTVTKLVSCRGRAAARCR